MKIHAPYPWFRAAFPDSKVLPPFDKAILPTTHGMALDNANVFIHKFLYLHVLIMPFTYTTVLYLNNLNKLWL